MDPLGITNFRVRGMWEIKNPLKVFNYVYHFDERKNFSLAALLTKEKYCSYPERDRIALENDKQITSNAVNVKNPNNPAKSIEAQLVTVWW